MCSPLSAALGVVSCACDVKRLPWQNRAAAVTGHSAVGNTPPRLVAVGAGCRRNHGQFHRTVILRALRSVLWYRVAWQADSRVSNHVSALIISTSNWTKLCLSWILRQRCTPKRRYRPAALRGVDTQKAGGPVTTPAAKTRKRKHCIMYTFLSAW